MRIDDHRVHLSSTHVHLEQTRTTESLRTWGGRDSTPLGAAVASPAQDTMTLSGNAAAGANPRGSAEDVLEGTDGSRLMLWKLLLEKLTGRKIRLLRAEDLDPPAPPESPAAGSSSALPGSDASGFEYTVQELHAESESSSFSGQGVVRTADGREIRFAVQQSLEREHVEVAELTVRSGPAPKDPIVLNLDETAVQLAGGRFAFDIDSDGAAEAVPLLSKGSAFLTFDRNGDGRVNDGSELFGPSTGDGFDELAALDGDHNRWIDENDADFGRLGLWSPVSGGSIVPLAVRGVGAIYLDRAATPFEIRTPADQTLGQLRATGVYLREDGTAGTVQQLDLSV
jgi:hypothetical protein